ncbi:MAG: acyl-CoA dehydrogenase family protein [Desulfobacterales bacterium]|jgi:alkylation response protein AidB-like acyl-CoA dehydrogenase
MDISLSKAQKDIAKEARRFLKKECTIDYIHEMYEDESGFSDDLWDKMAAMDWMAMRIPEAYGGMEMEQIDLNLVLEEMGRAAVPGPFFSTVMLAAEAILHAGNEAQKETYLAGIADGKLKGTLALYEPDSGSDPGYIYMQARADGDGFVLNGTKLCVPDAHLVDIMICAARSDDGVTLFVVDTAAADGLKITPLPSMDATRRLSAVEFNNVRLGPESILGERNQGWKPLQRVLQRAQVGLAAECLGGAQYAMETATDYAKVRVQYDQPIGGFQAIKHRCADMFVAVESSRSILYWAAWAQDHADVKEAALAASAAKAFCTEAFTQVASGAIQVLGGTGFTWENGMHVYLKRAKANEAAFGDPDFHRERVVQLLTE